MKQALGFVMLAAPFVVWVILGFRLVGWKVTISTLLGVAGLIAWFFAALTLGLGETA